MLKKNSVSTLLFSSFAADTADLDKNVCTTISILLFSRTWIWKKCLFRVHCNKHLIVICVETPSTGAGGTRGHRSRRQSPDPGEGEEEVEGGSWLSFSDYTSTLDQADAQLWGLSAGPALQQHVREISTILKLTFMQILFYQTSADVKFFIKVILNKISTSTQPSLPSNQFLQFQVNIWCCRGPAASLSQLLILCRNKLSSTGKFDTLTPGGAELGWAGESQYFKPGSNRLFIAELETNLRVVWSSFTIMEKAPT